MLILQVMFKDGHFEEYRFCTMEGTLAHLAKLKEEGDAKAYKITEID